jgi:hypothetical protein
LCCEHRLAIAITRCPKFNGTDENIRFIQAECLLEELC